MKMPAVNLMNVAGLLTPVGGIDRGVGPSFC